MLRLIFLAAAVSLAVPAAADPSQDCVRAAAAHTHLEAAVAAMLSETLPILRMELDGGRRLPIADATMDALKDVGDAAERLQSGIDAACPKP